MVYKRYAFPRGVDYGLCALVTPNLSTNLLWRSPESLFFFKFYLFIHKREREREAETQAEGEAGSMPGAHRGTLSWDSRIVSWAKGRCQATEPPRDPLEF